MLVFIHVFVSIAYQVGNVILSGIDRKPETGPNTKWRTMPDQREACGCLLKLFNAFFCGIRVASGHEDGKFVTPKPCNKIISPGMGSQILAKMAQDCVARRVAVLVIYLFEAIKISNYHKPFFATARRAGKSFAGSAHKAATVIQAGEFVGFDH